jgi:mycoredoxin
VPGAGSRVRTAGGLGRAGSGGRRPPKLAGQGRRRGVCAAASRLCGAGPADVPADPQCRTVARRAHRPGCDRTGRDTVLRGSGGRLGGTDSAAGVMPSAQVGCCGVLRSWSLAGFVLVCGVVVATTLFAQDSPGLGVIELIVFLVLACLLSPLPFPRSRSAAEVRGRSVDDGRPVVYWRPGCRYCLRLRLRLGRDARRAYWVNIWSDPAGAAAVRAVTGGDETVPTAVVEGRSFINPDPRWLRDRLRTLPAHD